VSITTVSKVLNNRADISEATRTRVLAKVEELGYQQQRRRRSLSLAVPHDRHRHSGLMHSFFVEVMRDRAGGERARLGCLLCTQ